MENIKHWSSFQKISLGILFVIPFAFLAVFWVGRGGAQTATTTTTGSVACSYTYANWTNCDSSGHQSRAVNSSTPSGCTGTPDNYRSCTYTASTAPICAYTYTAWSACNSSGQQYRAVSSKTPSGCVGGTQESLTRSCAYQNTTTVPICAFSYSAWSDCQSNGMQARHITGQTPSGCTGGTQESLSRGCTYVPPASTTTTTAPMTTTTPVTCAYTYTAWSNCDSSGHQYRTVNSMTPSGCVGTSETYRTCAYAPPTTGTTTTAPIACAFSYTNWSNCDSSGRQYRAVNSMTPSGCVGGNQESLSRSCTYTSATGSAIANTGTACAYTYANWTNCDSNGRQYRAVNSATPSGCTGTPDTYRNCTYVPITTSATTISCTSSCSSWGACESNGFMSRNCTAPSGCPQTSWVEKNTCTYNSGATSSTASTATVTTAQPTSCAYQCSSWSNCYSGGYQERMCQKPYGLSCLASQEKRACTYAGSATGSAVSTDAASCSVQCSAWSVCSPAGIRSQSCWPSAAGCPGETKTNTEVCKPAICKFAYSAWGSCADGWQFRNIEKTDPAGCVGGEPVLKQECSSGEEIAVAEEEIVPATTIVDPEISVNDDWKKETFKTSACQDNTCGGNADPDSDGLANNDEYRYGTDPLNPDTDRDGKNDGEEVAKGSNPLKSSAKGEEDAITFENPKEAGTAKETIYQVTNVEMVSASEGEKKEMKLTGKGPANSYVTVYVYSGDPVIVTVKTDSNGDWTYTVDKELEDGDHQVYVAVTNNSGAIKAKSNPLPFVKTAQAVTVAKAAGGELPVQSATQAGVNLKMLLFIVGISFLGVALAVILIGLVIKKIANKMS